MCKKVFCLFLVLLLTVTTEFIPGLSINNVKADAPIRRIVDNTHPLNIVSYYGAGDETILQCWNAVPSALKPYSALMVFPMGNMAKADEMLATCQANNIPVIIQAISGETRVSQHTPISSFQTLLQNYSCLIGFNAAELYNSIGWYGESDGNHSQYLADLINMCSSYGAYFIWSDTNIFGTYGTMLDWIQNNSNLIGALRAHKDNFIVMNKESYGDTDTDSLCLGLWLAGLAGNWGVAPDWWHWQVDESHMLFSDGYTTSGWKQPMTFPEEMYVMSYIRGISEGATVFHAEGGLYSNSFKGVQTPVLLHALMPFWSKIIDGTYTIPSKASVLSKNKIAYKGIGAYAVPYISPYSNLYMNTGRYGIIPLLPTNVNATEQANFDIVSATSVTLPYLNSLYPSEASGDTFASRNGAQWYWMNNSENVNIAQSSSMKPQINTSTYFNIMAGPHTSAVIKESATKFTGHLGNYRADKDSIWYDGVAWDAAQIFSWMESVYIPNPYDNTLRTTTITIRGSYNGNQPLLSINGDNGFTYSQAFDFVNKVYTLSIQHNGPVDFEITADGANNPQLYTNDYDSGAVTNLQAVTGSPAISAVSGGVRIAASSGESRVIDNSSYSMRDLTYAFSMKPGVNSRCGGIIRYVDSNTYTWFGYENDGHWRIREVINGSSAGDIYVASSVLSPNDFHTVQIIANNKNIFLTCDGNVIYNGLLNNLQAPVAGKVGFVGWSVMDASFDNVVQNAVVNRAAGKVPTTSATFLNPSRMTDGDINTANYMDSYPNNGLQWAQLDLGASYNLNAVKLWHYYGDTRSYHDVIVQLSNDPTFTTGVTTVFNNDTNNSAGRGAGTDAEYVETSAGKNIAFSTVNARYIRMYSNGSTVNGSNHYVEAAVF